jgi:hypothetical protein
MTELGDDVATRLRALLQAIERGELTSDAIELAYLRGAVDTLERLREVKRRLES